MGEAVVAVVLLVAFATALGDAFSSGPNQHSGLLCVLLGIGAAIFASLVKRVDLAPGLLMLLIRIVVFVGLMICVCGCLYEILVLTGAHATTH